jgi:hypothetical protein
MSDTANLRLPLLEAAQAQKHVTVNEGLGLLDALAQIAVQDRDLAAPPAAPVDGQCWIVGADPTGAWAGRAGQLAAWRDGAWRFSAPRAGWIAYAVDEAAYLMFDGAAWGDFFATLSALQNLAALGVNATADATNRLAVASGAVLFNHAGAGVQVKLNKQAAADTASLLFQDDFGGRAEIGLAGDDDLRVKVSADGAAWHEALRVERASGRVGFPSGADGVRAQLDADRTYYVRTDGSDANDGLADNAAGALRTIQKAVDTVGALDIGTFDVTVQVRAGTYGGGVVLKNFAGAGTARLVGDLAIPANVVIDKASGDVVGAPGLLSAWTVGGFKITTTSGQCVGVRNGGSLQITGPMEYGATSNYHMFVSQQSTLIVTSGYTIGGGANHHIRVENAAMMQIGGGLTITLAGTPAFAAAFIGAYRLAAAIAFGVTFAGAATGVRYRATLNSVIETNGGGAAYLPGDAAGVLSTGGQYS